MKKLIVLLLAAAALVGAALWLKGGRAHKTPNLVGRKILPAFNISDVARVEITGAKSLALASGEAGWSVDALHGYPADAAKIRDALLKLQDLKAGQPATGISNAAPTTVVLKDAAGKELAKLVMGEQHRSAPRGEMAQFGGGGYPDGRYVTFDGATVLVNDALDAFDGDPKKWVETKVCGITASDVKEVTYAKGKETVKLTRKDSTWTLEGLGPKEELDTSKTYSLDSALSYLNFANVVDPKKTEAELGFATGAVYTATLKNGITYTAKVGNKIGADSAFKVSAAFKPVGTNATENAACEKTVKDFNDTVGKWTYTISSYSAESMSKTRKDLVKAKEEPKKEEAKPAEKKPEAKPAPAAKPAETKKPEAKATPAAKPAEAKKPEPKKVETKPVEKKVESKPAAKPAPAPAAKPAPAPAAKPAAKPAK